jgi:hypothetical protein
MLTIDTGKARLAPVRDKRLCIKERAVVGHLIQKMLPLCAKAEIDSWVSGFYTPRSILLMWCSVRRGCPTGANFERIG